ncbi:SCPU domain-containing protein [Rheinheimera riviphila]|uniref:SCPU domain-containing protein n=1 Tax=Rheinheimera riviphila TaxID=1834037 RepID=A0A437QFY9_9GAMM|nr:spore coat U domain-containing protein [Rheinheimera riviphila]RVU33422.1 SCPU domain-containing protein [Rheinheimera riviphila]
MQHSLRFVGLLWLLLYSHNSLSRQPVVLQPAAQPTVLQSSTQLPSSQQQSIQQSTELAIQLAQSCQLSGDAVGGNFGTLHFGSFSQLPQPVQLTSQSNAGSILLRCNLGVDFKILINRGLHGASVAARQLREPNHGSTLNYQLYRDAQFSTVWDDTTGLSGVATGTAQQFDLYAVLPSQPIAASGNYSDTLTVTISW